MAYNLEPGASSVFAQVIVLPVGTALSGLLTWLFLGNLYGAVAFVVLFVVGIVTETVRQRRRAHARRTEADLAMGTYIPGLHDAVYEAEALDRKSE